ncbi:hypothetical protein PLICRDRAFT_37651 [Plicaturopsis crispa FD-325 SS-3]|nr:hypothetical protein PLICRDRAFT_37651 [Plicaturopsis crispa FD-325 SS-3]
MIVLLGFRNTHGVACSRPRYGSCSRHIPTIFFTRRRYLSVIAVHTGLLERKKRYTRSYWEPYLVLTPAGFLPEYASSDSVAASTPLFSLFFPACTQGPLSSSSVRSHKFHIRGRKWIGLYEAQRPVAPVDFP